MRVLVAGGIFRVPVDERRRRQPTPEMTLTQGLLGLGVEVENCGLEDLGAVTLSRQVDVVHVHHLSKAAVLGALSPLRRPFIFTPHDSRIPRKATHLMGMRVVAARMSAGICLSKRESETLGNRFPASRDRLHVIANGIELPGAALRRSLGDGRIRALYVGQLIDVKRVDRLLLAVNQLPEVELRLVYHNSRLEQSLMKRALELGIADRVNFVGQRWGSALIEEYASAQVFVLPSESESLPSALAEALASGLPTVASDVGGVPDLVRGAGILTDPHDDTDLGRGLRELLENFDSFALAAAARASKVRDELSVDASARRHLALYERLLS